MRSGKCPNFWKLSNVPLTNSSFLPAGRFSVNDKSHVSKSSKFCYLISTFGHNLARSGAR